MAECKLLASRKRQQTLSFRRREGKGRGRDCPSRCPLLLIANRSARISAIEQDANRIALYTIRRREVGAARRTAEPGIYPGEGLIAKQRVREQEE